jgi:hypothetical protein
MELVNYGDNLDAFDTNDSWYFHVNSTLTYVSFYSVELNCS